MPPKSPASKPSTRGSGIPLGFEHLLHPQNTKAEIPRRKSTQSSSTDVSGPLFSRFRLHIRQQPVATRACAAGEKDRRPIDPPPILQMLLMDFDSRSDDDLELLQNPRYAVACLLYAVRKSGPEDEDEKLIHSTHTVNENNSRKRRESHEENSSATSPSDSASSPHPRAPVQVLSGKTYVSPFYAPTEPDPETAPGHPSSQPGRSSSSLKDTGTIPATFFVFADLSVRTAGVYRLKFRLMDWGMAFETGKSQPILAETLSEPFRVFSSKDFPGMKESSALTWKLKQMGMFELKPRSGKGKGRRRAEDENDGYE